MRAHGDRAGQDEKPFRRAAIFSTTNRRRLWYGHLRNGAELGYAECLTAKQQNRTGIVCNAAILPLRLFARRITMTEKEITKHDDDISNRDAFIEYLTGLIKDRHYCSVR
jgi:hypothetical protein